MSDENELNESEMDQLLRELEQKSSTKPKESKQTKTEAPKKVRKKEPKKKLPAQSPKTSEVANPVEPPGVSVVQRGSSESLNRKISIFIFFLSTPLLLAAVWMLGNYLASFISVGWLIAIVSLVGVLGLSYFFKRIVGKGRFMVWSGLVSLLLLVAMLLPATFATTKMIEYGHWPISSITKASAMETDNTFVSFSNRVSKTLAELRFRFGEGELSPSVPRELGKVLPLIPEIKPLEPNVEEGTKDPILPDEKSVEPKVEEDKENVETP